jgi:hypothetical protein
MGWRELWLNVMVPWQERRRLNGGYPPSAVVPQAVERPAALQQKVERLKSRR